MSEPCEGVGGDAPGRVERAVGWTAVRRDWAHFVRVSGEAGFAGYLRVLWDNPSLWALWIYRYGYWTYCRCSGLAALPHKVLYRVFYYLGHVFFKVALDAQAEILDDVWLSPAGNILVGSYAHIGTGSYLHGWNTFGLLAGSDIRPRMGNRVHLGPGSLLIGPVVVPDDTVIGANSVVVRSIPASGAWTGTPVRPFEGAAERLIVSPRTGRGARKGAHR